MCASISYNLVYPLGTINETQIFAKKSITHSIHYYIYVSHMYNYCMYMCINTEQCQLVYELQLYLCVASICLSLYINTHTFTSHIYTQELVYKRNHQCHNDSISVTMTQFYVYSTLHFYQEVYSTLHFYQEVYSTLHFYQEVYKYFTIKCSLCRLINE